MISIKKDFAALPDKLISSIRVDLILDSITTKNKHVFSSKVYRDTTLSALEKLYKSKCAYCETDTSAGAPMQVEHYRPKAKVTEDSTHLGYYWVAYEWSNLILSCSKCNNKKRNRFPILGNRIVEPVLDGDGLPTNEFRVANSAAFAAENVLLLHPEIDNIEEQFLFKVKCEIIGLTQKAQKTIEVCGLNREELVFKRLSISNKIKNDIKEILTSYIGNKITSDQCRYAIKRVFSELALLQVSSNQYSRFGYFLFNKFDIFIVSELEEKQKGAVRKLFDQFLKGML
jgi:uncharacterized protein (TIGR02646 family)